ncbi:MAG: hypothetical protein Q7J35_13860 [Candidatus Methanoperedens sp.]|nr:hypothetical protein [Candidatus Methanoperedens sp.]
MYKIQLENGDFYKSKSGRIQHYSLEKAETKIQKLGEIASGAKAVECSTKTKSTKNAKPVKAVVKAEKKKAKKSKKSTA